jgi:hypothetical protein
MAYQVLARRLKFLIASFSRHGAGHVVEVFRQERIRRRYAQTPEPLPDVDAFIAGFDPGLDRERFVADFARTASSRTAVSADIGTDELLRALTGLQDYDRILEEAARFCAGTFTGLGVSICEPGGVFDWHRDYSSGKVWPQVPFHRIDFGGGDGADVKYVWELSRMYWIAWLGKAYKVSGDGRWADEFRRLIDDWSRANPINVGVNWALPMEVAIRAFWLAAGFGFFHEAPEIDDAWWLDYLRLLWGHGSYLENNLEYFSNLTNHYISNCFGLVAVGVFFAGHPRADRWLAEGRRRMIAELDHQVLADGVHYERSICYHRLVLEMYLIAATLLEKASRGFTADALGTIEKMAEFLHDYVPRHGTVPQLGDSDDGLILRLSQEQEIYDHRDTLALAATIFGRSDFLAQAGGRSQAALLISGVTQPAQLRAESAPRRDRLYREGGFATLRSAELELFADVGEIGLHGNNDTLSFTLHGPDGAIILDPGTYCYTRDPATRNRLRATQAHNGPCLDGREIAEFDGLWRVKEDRTRPKVVAWEPGLLAAEHHAYRTLPGQPVVRRTWKLSGGELAITDHVGGSGEHAYTVRFALPDDYHVVHAESGRIELSDGHGGRLSISSDAAHLTVHRDWYSPSYGVAAPALMIDAGRRGKAPFSISYICSFSRAPGGR